MKAMRFATLLIVFFAIGCAGTYRVVKKGDIPFRSYGKIIVSRVGAEEFWSKNPNLKNNKKWTSEVKRVSDYIEATLSTYSMEKWSRDEGEKVLKIEADMFEFNPGSRARRYFVGFGAGKGRIGYHVTLRDASTAEVVSQFDAYGTLVGGIFGGNVGNAYGRCAYAIISYINDNY